MYVSISLHVHCNWVNKSFFESLLFKVFSYKSSIFLIFHFCLKKVISNIIFISVLASFNCLIWWNGHDIRLVNERLRVLTTLEINKKNTQKRIWGGLSGRVVNVIYIKSLTPPWCRVESHGGGIEFFHARKLSSWFTYVRSAVLSGCVKYFSEQQPGYCSTNNTWRVAILLVKYEKGLNWL